MALPSESYGWIESEWLLLPRHSGKGAVVMFAEDSTMGFLRHGHRTVGLGICGSLDQFAGPSDVVYLGYVWFPCVL